MDAARGVRTNNVLGHQHIAGAGHGKIGFSGEDHSKFLQSAGDLHVRIAITVGHDFTQVHGTSFRSNGPQDIGEIFGAKAARWLQVMEAGINGQTSGMTSHLGPPLNLWDQRRAFEVHLGCAAPVAIVDGRGGTLNYIHFEREGMVCLLNIAILVRLLGRCWR